MLKVDARILGFSVTASEDRINVGDIDTVWGHHRPPATRLVLSPGGIYVMHLTNQANVNSNPRNSGGNNTASNRGNYHNRPTYPTRVFRSRRGRF